MGLAETVAAWVVEEEGRESVCKGVQVGAVVSEKVSAVAPRAETAATAATGEDAAAKVARMAVAWTAEAEAAAARLGGALAGRRGPVATAMAAGARVVGEKAARMRTSLSLDRRLCHPYNQSLSSTQR